MAVHLGIVSVFAEGECHQMAPATAARTTSTTMMMPLRRLGGVVSVS